MADLNYLYSIALPTPLRRSFVYFSNQPNISPGTRVSVPFGRQKAVMGIVVASTQTCDIPPEKLRAIHKVLESTPSLTVELIELCQWCAGYYHYPLGEVFHMALPALLRKPEQAPSPREQAWRLTPEGEKTDIKEFKATEKQKTTLKNFKEIQIIDKATCLEWGIHPTTLHSLVSKGLIEPVRDLSNEISHSLPREILKQAPLILNPEQQQAITSITVNKFVCYLIEGVTGSGKTEIYLQVMESVLRNDKQVLVLVPEIGLTPQTLARFKARFQLPITVLHSGLANKQRFEIWQQAINNQVRIVIGTRSSVFTPLENLGLIIVDEEHDLSYKQQDGVRYSARDLAIVRAQKNNIPILLGSATPSLESLHNALYGRYQHLQLHRRANKAALPNIHCVEAEDESLKEETQRAMAKALNQGQQVLVFINRRGYAPTLICPDCGWISQCQRCDSRMTLHRERDHSPRSRSEDYLHCHSCDSRRMVPRCCPLCHSANLQALGSGTQRSEEQLSALFPNTKILRIDRDSVARKGQWQTVLDEIHSQKPCILVGTQMLAKGHHFSNLGLAVILGLDNAFFSSDFRGPERMGQLLTQVSGRVGREQRQGNVLIQTRFSDHPLLKELIQAGYHRLAQSLLAERQTTAMPPWRYLAFIRCHSPEADTSHRFLQEARCIAENLNPPDTNIQYLGPFPATPEKRNNRFHHILQIKTADRQTRQQLLDKLCLQLEQKKISRGIYWLIDVDPQEL